MNTVPYLPETAPFSPEQRAWLNGFLAGTFARRPLEASSSAEPIAAVPKTPVTLVWGSQTGNAETLAKDAKKRLDAAGAEVTVFDLAEYPVERLSSEANLLVITSTYGEGEPPDNARDFHQFLLGDEAPRLEKTRFAVLGLGDTNYPDFCQTGKDFDQRFEALGGQRWTDRVDCDVDFEDPFESWIESLSKDLGSAPAPVEKTESSEAVAYSKKNPFPAKLLTNLELNAEGSAKDTRHLEFSLAGSGLSYEVGDALGVFPKNKLEAVKELIAAVDLDPDEALSSENGLTLAEVLLVKYDIQKLTLPFLQAAAALGTSAELQALAERCADDRNAFQEYAWGREIIDVILDFKVTWSSAEAFLGALKKIQPRLYSISSSPKAHTDEVHLTVGVVRFESHGRSRGGLCSTYLAESPAESTEVGVFVHGNKAFKTPADLDTPIIMVGPGTGIAPFRAFLEEREATGAKGENWLFFGDQHAASDFLYADQIAAWRESGLLTRLDTAFSRDQKEKIYVQNRMLEAGEELATWLARGAYFYVCGDASRMAKDVDQALRIIATQYLCTGDSAAGDAYIDEMAKSKRYVRDVY